MTDLDLPAGRGPQLGRNLTFGILDVIGRDIVVGEYRTRAFPTEGDLVKRYGVSRSVIREAVKMLSAKGLLSARPKQGTFVRPEEDWSLFDTDVLRWILERRTSIGLLRYFTELRLAVEPQAAAVAAIRATPSQQSAISRGLERMVQAEKGLDDALEADIEFHVAVLRASNNPFFAQFRDIVATALQTSIRFTNRISGRTADIAEHAAVRDAILARDPDHARESMFKLISDALAIIEKSETSDK